MRCPGAILTLILRTHALGLSPSDVKERVSPLVDKYSTMFNASVQFGYADATGAASYAAGLDDIWSGTRMTERTLIPLGSSAKTFTAAAVMQFVEKGVVSLEDPAHVRVDPVLRRLNGTSLGELWPAPSPIHNVTIKDLMGMTAGIQDYNDTAMKLWTWAHPGEDLSPFEYLHAVNKTFACSPGSCGYYSGINYILLGLLLVNLTESSDWTDYDQATVIPEDLMSTHQYDDLLFALKGPCSHYLPRVAHQYSIKGTPEGVEYFDMVDDSCLNGWTMGNILTTTRVMSVFYRDLFINQGFVSLDSIAKMMEFKPLCNSWAPGLPYGLGLIMLSYPSADPNATNDAYLVGHPGEDWGSGTTVCGFSPVYNFSMCLASNAQMGMNCSFQYWVQNEYLQYGVGCEILSEVFQAHGGPKLDCVIAPKSQKFPNPSCKWEHGASAHSPQGHHDFGAWAGVGGTAYSSRPRFGYQRPLQV